MTQPPTIRSLVREWEALADDFNVTRGDSEVEAAYHAAASQLATLLDAHYAFKERRGRK